MSFQGCVEEGGNTHSGAECLKGVSYEAVKDRGAPSAQRWEAASEGILLSNPCFLHDLYDFLFFIFKILFIFYVSDYLAYIYM